MYIYKKPVENYDNALKQPEISKYLYKYQPIRFVCFSYSVVLSYIFLCFFKYLSNSSISLSSISFCILETLYCSKYSVI